MTKRLQVRLEDEELAAIQLQARKRGISVAEWVRQSLRETLAQMVADSDAKRRAVGRALTYSFPTCDVRQMLAEIGSGYAAADEGPA
jgi:Ribbon-helix-helix protein, copG family